MLVDGFSRRIDYLRISVTKECNFRCLYCMPKLPFNHDFKQNLLSLNELFLFVKIAIDEGVKKVRITGGEPLLREGLEDFIEKIKSYASHIDLALTTNAFLLAKKAQSLKNAGLERINISLDTLNHKKAAKIAQKDVLSEVLAGINEALKVGLKVKFNCVVLRDLNDDELIDLLEFSMQKNSQIRFIEFMENHHAYGRLRGLNSREILDIISAKYKPKEVQKNALNLSLNSINLNTENSSNSALNSLNLNAENLPNLNSKNPPNSPSRIFELENGYKFGIIDPHSDEFCASCNRIRLSADGLLIPCLYFEDALSIQKALKNSDLNEALKILKKVIANKPEKNKWSKENNEISTRAFYETGG